MDAANHAASVFSDLSDWAAHPFSEDMDLTDWGLFTGLIIVLSILWIMVLRDLRGEL